MKRGLCVLSIITFLALSVPSLAQVATAASTAAFPAQIASSTTVTPDTTAGDWPEYVHDIKGSGSNPNETIISTSNASSMGVLWRFNLPNWVHSQATIANGMVFFADNSGNEHALDLGGHELWKTNIGVSVGNGTTIHYTQGPVGTALFANYPGGAGGPSHVLYVTGGYGQTFALNADNGNVIWSQNTTDPQTGGFLFNSPLLYNNSVYIGISSEADMPLNVGALVRYDAVTGVTQAVQTMPPPPPAVIVNGVAPYDPPDGSPCVAGGIWGSPTVDTSTNTLYIATGTYDGHCSVPPTLEEAVVAMDATTLAVKDHWANPKNTNDSDFGSVPTLFDATIGGTLKHMVGVANKDGNFYALDRTNLKAGPVWHTMVSGQATDPTTTGAIDPAAYDGHLIYESGGQYPNFQGTTMTMVSVVTAMDPVTGTPVWQRGFNRPDDGDSIGPVTYVNGVVIVDEGLHMMGLKATDGSVLFDVVPGTNALRAGASVSNGVVYVGTSKGTGTSQFLALQPSTVPPQADVSISQSGPAAVTPGSGYSYTLTVTNHGPNTATGVTAVDTLPLGVTFGSASAGCSHSGGTVTCSVGTLSSGATSTLVINVTAPASTGTITNHATVSANENDPVPANNSSTLTTNVAFSADLAITKSGPASVQTGAGFSYTIVASNNGPTGATGVTVSDPLPAGTAFVSASSTQGTCANASGTVTCSVGSVASGGSATITINVTAPGSAGTISNTASIHGNEPDPSAANNSATASVNVTSQPPPPPPATADVSITKTGPSSAAVGFGFDYTLTISNAGPSAATGVTAHDTLPAGVSFSSAAASQGTCTAAGAAVTCSLGTLTSFGSAQVSIHVIPAAVGTVTNQATASANQPDPNMANNTSAPVTTTIKMSPGPLGAGLPGPGYWLVATDGGIFNFGTAGFMGSTGSIHLNQPIVAMAPTPTGGGYWLVASDGGIFNYGGAAFFGSTGAIHLNQPIVGMAATPTGKGYWLVATDGGIFSFGDAKFFGSTGAIHLNKPIVGMAATPSGKGYWLVASDGGIFNYGDAAFFGSTGAIHLNKPIVGMGSTPSGRGYWLVATDGGIFNYGDAAFLGSTGAIHLNQPIVGMVPTATGGGYWMVATDGGIFTFGDAAFMGSTGAIHLNKPVVGMA